MKKTCINHIIKLSAKIKDVKKDQSNIKKTFFRVKLKNWEPYYSINKFFKGLR